MKKIRFISIILVLLMMLTSCNITSFDTDGLLSPPQMNTANNEILKTLRSVIGNSYELIYPSSGNYQTAIISVDLTGNNVNEAVCFYTDGTDKKVNVIILESIESTWKARGIFKSQASSVERVEFTDIDKDGIKETIIGWQYLSGEEKALEILSFGKETEMMSRYTGMYNNVIVFDDCVVSISKNTSGKTASATLIGKGVGEIEILATVALNNAISAFVSIKDGLDKNGKRTIYVDEQLESLVYTTELLTVGDYGELTIAPDEISSLTTRTRASVCTDVDSDGHLDIPTEHMLPEYERNGVKESLVYISWYGYDGVKFDYIKSGYVSVNELFFLEIPENWLGKINIQRDVDSERAIHFYITENEMYIPVFSIRVFSQLEFTDTVQSLGWKAVTTANENVYAYRADTGEIPYEFKTDIDMITERFSLIS